MIVLTDRVFSHMFTFFYVKRVLDEAKRGSGVNVNDLPFVLTLHYKNVGNTPTQKHRRRKPFLSNHEDQTFTRVKFGSKMMAEADNEEWEVPLCNNLDVIRDLWWNLKHWKETKRRRDEARVFPEDADSDEELGEDLSEDSENSESWGAVFQQKKENMKIVRLYRWLYPGLVYLAETRTSSVPLDSPLRSKDFSELVESSLNTFEGLIYDQIYILLLVLVDEDEHVERELSYPLAKREEDKARMDWEELHPRLDKLGRRKYLPIHPGDLRSERKIYYGRNSTEARYKRRHVIRKNRAIKLKKDEEDLLEQETNPKVDDQGKRKYLPIRPGQRKSERRIYWDLSYLEAQSKRRRIALRHQREAVYGAKVALTAQYLTKRAEKEAGTYKGRKAAYRGHPADIGQLKSRYPGKWFWLE